MVAPASMMVIGAKLADINFKGIFNGNGHTIYGVYVNQQQAYKVGLYKLRCF